MPPSLLPSAVLWLCLLRSAAASARGEHDHDYGDYVGGSGPSPRKRTRSKAGGRDPGAVPPKPDEERASGRSLCKSVIAQDGWRASDADSHVESGRVRPNLFREWGQEIAVPYEAWGGSHRTDEEFLCELRDGTTLPLQGSEVQVNEMRSLLNSGRLVSGVSSIMVEEGDEGAGFASSIGGLGPVMLRPGPVQLIDDDGEDDDDIVVTRRRRLQGPEKYQGPKRTLILRVTDREGRAPSGDAGRISDKWFGTDGDQITARRGLAECSHGAYDLTPDYGDALPEDILAKFSAPGVLDVSVGIALPSTTQERLRDKVLRAARRKLRTGLPGPFDHVVIVVEKCYPVGTSCAFAAYAFINHWLSLFHSEYYEMAAVQIHELGHNLNFAHSGGLDGRTYTDHTCLMGNPLWGDDLGKMCFNPVKNFQIAKGGESWYQDETIRIFDTDTESYWSGRIVGVAEYGDNLSGHPIVFKLETGGQSDFFVGFNRAAGPNSQNVQGDNKVAIYKVQEGDGLGYSHSRLEALLEQGQAARITNWRNSRKNLRIVVKEINTATVPGYAEVEFVFGQPPTPNPTPTPLPPPEPTTNPTEAPTREPTSAPSERPTKAPTNTPTDGPTSSPSLTPTNVPSKAPTSSPTVDPGLTGSPTGKPTAEPTQSPTKNPTSSPESPPSFAPTRMPFEDGNNQCNGNVCDPGETPETCASDCIRHIFKSSADRDARSSGVIFNVKAVDSDLTVSSFDIAGKKRGGGVCVVYTRLGGYADHETDATSWVRVFNREVEMRRGGLSGVGPLDPEVTIAAGDTQAFYIFCRKGLMYEKGWGGGDQTDEAGLLVVEEGVETRRLFQNASGNARFSGWIRFYASPQGR